ncbi:hypothetical protein Tco_0223177 [Tanacetum coccineum]
MAPKRATRSIRVPPVTPVTPIPTTTTVTEAQLQALIDQGVAAAMAEAEASRVRNGYNSKILLRGGDPSKEDERYDQEKDASVNSTNNVNVASTNEVNVVGRKASIELSDEPNMPALEDFCPIQLMTESCQERQSTPMDKSQKAFRSRIEMVEEVDDHLYRIMIGSFYVILTFHGTEIMFVVQCAYERYQVKPKGFTYYCCKMDSLGFEQIVDFLNANLIRYALTINPTIYTSCIEQFWATVKVKTVSGEVYLQALVDGKKIILTEASIRRDLQLNDEEGMDCFPNANIFAELTRMGFVQLFLEKQLEGMSNHKRIYVTPSHTMKIFGNMRRVGKGFSRRETPLFPAMMVQAQEEMGKGSANPTDPHHTPTIIQP